MKARIDLEITKCRRLFEWHIPFSAAHTDFQTSGKHPKWRFQRKCKRTRAKFSSILSVALKYVFVKKWLFKVLNFLALQIYITVNFCWKPRKSLFCRSAKRLRIFTQILCLFLMHLFLLMQPLWWVYLKVRELEPGFRTWCEKYLIRQQSIRRPQSLSRPPSPNHLGWFIATVSEPGHSSQVTQGQLWY